MRLIDADALIGKVFKNDISYNAFKSLVKREPTVDAVPVVRCKDCEYYTEEDRWCIRLGLCGAFEPNGYCSHAERKEDETD